ncbi:MAG: CheR family methyltransferase [Amaricoccus sp.]|uniref:CheR family methyltransferase n=1 Tax=Amaricoccus sp. TaxID=1872485 RepID=UPI0039E30647
MPGAGRFRLEPEDFVRLARLVQAEGGISLPEAKAVLVRTRLVRRLRALGLRSFAAYADVVEGAGDAAAREREEMLSALTTNVTRFFREPHHFDTLRERLLPALAARARAGGRVRLWSAGCSTGEEPYSLALTVLEALPEAATLDVRILATDLDRRVLATGTAGLYAARAAQSIPPASLARHFRRVASEDGTRYAAGPALRALVTFRQLNLARPLPVRGHFDAIFCRNVVIYFDEATERQVWCGLSQRLLPGGWLFIGHSERIDTGALPELESDGVSSYRRVA